MLPDRDATNLPQQWTFDPLQKKPVSFDIRSFNEPIANGCLESRWVKERTIDLNFALRAVNKLRTHLPGRFEERRWAQVLKDQSKASSILQLYLQVFNCIRG